MNRVTKFAGSCVTGTGIVISSVCVGLPNQTALAAKDTDKTTEVKRIESREYDDHAHDETIRPESTRKIGRAENTVTATGTTFTLGGKANDRRRSLDLGCR